MANDLAKLHVGFLFDDSLDSEDGVSQYVKTVGGWLSHNGHTVSYLVGESKLQSWRGGRVYSLSKNLRVRWAGNRLSMSLLPKLKLIKQLMSQQEFDVVHIQVPYSPFMAQLVINALPSQTALVGSVHIYPASQLSHFGSKLLKTVYGRSFKRIDKLLSVSSAAQDYAKASLSSQTTVSPNVIDLARFQGYQRPPQSNTQHIVFLGRLVKRKGPMQLIEAFSLLAKDLPKAHLTIAGTGPLRRKLEHFVKQHALEDRVSFAGFVDEADKPGLLASADVACFPSLYGESFGIVLLEAMAAGSGVVLGGDNAGYTAVLSQQPPLLVNPRFAPALAERLKQLLLDAELRTKLHLWQLNEIKKYDISVVGPQLVEIYKSAIALRKESLHNKS